MSRDKSRFPASVSDSDEEDESESYSDSSTASINDCGACRCCKRSEEIAELKQKLSLCESYQRESNEMLRHQIGMNGSMIETLNRLNLMCKQNLEKFKQTRKKFKRKRKKFKRNLETQQSMMQMIEEIRFVVMMASLPPEQLSMQQQQPPQPAATLQPQPKHRRTPRGYKIIGYM